MALIAVCIFAFSDRPMGGVAMFFCAGAMGFGAWLLVQPFLKNQTAELKGRNLDALNPVSDQLRRLEELRHLLSETVAKAPVAKDYEPTLKEISSAIESIREAHEASYVEIKNSWTQDIAGLESRALHAIQSIQKVPAGDSPAPTSAPIPVAPAPEIKPDLIAGMVSEKLRPEWTAESEKTLTAMKEHVDESFSQAMSEMADLKLALEQALETIANAAPGAISVTAPVQPAGADTEKVKALMNEMAAGLDTKLKSQARSVQRLSTEVGGLRRMMRRAMNVKGGSWNVELATDDSTEAAPQVSDDAQGMNSGAGSDFGLNLPVSEGSSSEWTPFSPESDHADSVTTEPSTQPDPNDLLVYPSGSFPSPESFGGMEEEVLPTQFTEDHSEPSTQEEHDATLLESQIEEPSQQETPEEENLISAETPEEETAVQSSESTSEEAPEVAAENVESEEPPSPVAESTEEPAQVSPEAVQEEVSEEKPESGTETPQEAPIEKVEPAPEVAESEKSDAAAKKPNPQRLPSVKSAVRNLFEEAEQDEEA